MKPCQMNINDDKITQAFSLMRTMHESLKGYLDERSSMDANGELAADKPNMIDLMAKDRELEDALQTLADLIWPDMLDLVTWEKRQAWSNDRELERKLELEFEGGEHLNLNPECEGTSASSSS